MKDSKPKAEKKCTRGAHSFGPTADPWYQKCYFCPAIKQNASIKVLAVQGEKYNLGGKVIKNGKVKKNGIA